MGLVNLAVAPACAEAHRLVEAVEVALRLRMMMRRVRGPLARQVDNFAQNHVGVRRVVQIEAGAYITLDAAHQLALVAACPGIGVFRLVHLAREGLFVQSLLDVDVARTVRDDLELYALANVQAGRVVIERIRTVYVVGLILPLDGALAVEYQCCNFLLRLLAAPGVAVFHHEESNVHHGILADAFVKTDVLVVSALDLLIHVHRNSLQKIIFWCGDRYIPPDHADSAVQNSLSIIIIPRHNSQFQPLIERIRRGAERLCHSAQKSEWIFSQMIQQKYDWFVSHSCLPFLFHL